MSHEEQHGLMQSRPYINAKNELYLLNLLIPRSFPKLLIYATLAQIADEEGAP
jgi:hypothetical protein